MRIIDKRHDFYDYLQDPTDTIVFDRRNSFLLRKETICEAMKCKRAKYASTDSIYNHLVLQCGARFWVFLVTITDYTSDGIYSMIPLDFSLELLATWRNYNKPNVLIDLRLCGNGFPHITRDRIYRFKQSDEYFCREKVNPDTIRSIIDSWRPSQYDGNKSFNTFTIYDETKKEYHTYDIPLLNATDMANQINPIDIFCAIEEYFSIQKTAAERTEPLGATNNDKIIMHGFDTKTSFRGKHS